MLTGKNLGRTVLILIISLLAVASVDSQTTTENITYERLLSEAAARAQGRERADEVSEILKIIGTGVERLSAKELTAQIKRNFPDIDRTLPLRVLPVMRENLIAKGGDHERLLKITAPLLKFCGLEGKVFPLLYKSELPLVAISYPNALIFSTRSVALLSNDELEALAAHELGHLIGRNLFIKAVDNHDNRTLRLLELFYDGVAAVFLEAEGKDPRSLISALAKQQQVLDLEYDDPDRGTDHPTWKTRVRLNDELLRQFKFVARR